MQYKIRKLHMDDDGDNEIMDDDGDNGVVSVMI